MPQTDCLTTEESKIEVPAPEKAKAVTHRAYLDGLRGFAALYVVFHHSYLEFGDLTLPNHIRKLFSWLNFGHGAVGVFIVLSGYCLMAPVAASGHFKGGLKRYFMRRCQRILPPYYAALLLFVVAIPLIPQLNHVQGARWDESLPVLWFSSIASHVLLFHNLVPQWRDRIDPPMWSVATEFQLYFAFPFLLSPMCKALGEILGPLAAFFIGLTLGHLIPPISAAFPTFLGLFAMGMTAATWNSQYADVAPRVKRTLAVMLPIGILLALISRHYYPHDRGFELGYKDFFVGVFMMTIIPLMAAPKTSNQGILRRARLLLESRIAVVLGSFSYTLYLVHYPILSLIHALVNPYFSSNTVKLLLVMTIGPAVSISFAYCFYLLIERPTVRMMNRSR